MDLWKGRLRSSVFAGLALAAVLGAVALSTIGSAIAHDRPVARLLRTSKRHHVEYPGARQLRALAQGHRVALGVAPEYPISASLPAFDRIVGRPARIVGLYQAWSEPLVYGGQLREIAAHHAFPMIAWYSVLGKGPLALSSIVAGAEDGLLRAAARSATAWKHIILVRLDSEMNLPHSIAGVDRNGNTAAEFVLAWRHVVKIFRQAHATNVKWVWSPNVACGGKCPFKAFYPGDKWVDWVALDGYNYSVVDGLRWFSFKRIFGGSYTTLSRVTHKPMMVAETASAEAGGSKAGWITGMGRALATRFHRVRALVWFDRVKETNWKVNSARSSLAAFRHVVHSFPFTRR